MAAAAAGAVFLLLSPPPSLRRTTTTPTPFSSASPLPPPLSLVSSRLFFRSPLVHSTRSPLVTGFDRLARKRENNCVVLACLPPSSPPPPPPTVVTRLYISGLSFRTTEESLRNAFEKFGQLVEVNLVMDRVANRPRGFAFLRYTTEEEAKKAIEGMHGKFLDGRVIFVEVAKPRTGTKQF